MIHGTGLVDESASVDVPDIEAILSYLPEFEKAGFR
jgi:hypothetical protein